MADVPPPHNPTPAERGGQLAWSVVLNAILIAAFVLGAIPIVAIVRGFFELVSQSKIRSGADWLAYGFAFTGLFLGAVFFAYAIKYYLSTAMVLVTTLVGSGPRNGNGDHPTSNGLTRINGNGNGNGYHIDLGYHPFVSVHVAAYNEKRVIERLLAALDELEYPEYEVIVVDDSTDESIQILDRWRGRPRFKILHRNSREGYKGGALREALKVTDPRAEYVVVFDADSVPFPDSIERLLPHFYRVSDGTAQRRMESAFGRDDPPSEPGHIKRRREVAAVQSYQWHVLNKSESWLTEAVRVEYAGSYMVERPFQDAIGSLKMIAGTAYMIRADVLREVGWGTSITEDWELTLKLYTRGYKVVYTPWAETPAECVSTFSRLARQRMRWAEGHTYNVRKWFVPLMGSPFVTPLEKLEFLFDSTYYLQAGLFVIGTLSWLMSEIVFHTHVPGWTALLGWSLLFSNIFALPLMNLGGLILEEAPFRDLQGVLGAVVLSFALVPFQGWAAFKGLISRNEGPWFRTPKTGLVTDQVHHLRRLHLLRRWLLGPRAGRIASRSLAVQPPTAQHIRRRRHGREVGWVVVAAMVLALGALAIGATRVSVTHADSGSTFELFGNGTNPTIFSASNSNNTVRNQRFSSTCNPACPAVWTSGVGAYPGATASTTAAQTIFAGTWRWQYWTSNDGSEGTVNWTFKYGDNVGCTTNPVTIAAFTAVPLLVDQAGTIATLGTTSTNVTVPANKFMCLSITWNSGGPVTLRYGNHNSQRTNFTTPQVIFIPEFGAALLGLAVAIPLATQFWTRRRRPAKAAV
ncbi:MAG TPA: glycosyltransferase family 2 protein [Candidatus Dormibacteraeota bacterium]|nr:glycosyltransferase family 2 protein [Candidatus Dormibacteraeota bacterium]